MQVFLLDFSQGISLGLLCHIFVLGIPFRPDAGQNLIAFAEKWHFPKDFLQLRRTCALSTYASKQEDGEEEVLRLVLSDERTLHLVLTV